MARSSEIDDPIQRSHPNQAIEKNSWRLSMEDAKLAFIPHNWVPWYGYYDVKTGFALQCFTTHKYRNIKEQTNIKVFNFPFSLLCCYHLHSLNSEFPGNSGTFSAVLLLSQRQKIIQFLTENRLASSGTRLKVSCNTQDKALHGYRTKQAAWAHWASKATVLLILQESKESETDSFCEKIQLLYWLFQRGRTMSFLYNLMKYHQRRNYIIWNL